MIFNHLNWVFMINKMAPAFLEDKAASSFLRDDKE